MDDMFENILGGGDGLVGGIFGEAREALVGGCWGILMSGVFLFFFFLTGFALLFGVEGVDIALRGVASPFICLLGVSAILSPLVGVLFGAQSGFYSWISHLGCFVLYLALVIGAIIGVSVFL